MKAFQNMMRLLRLSCLVAVLLLPAMGFAQDEAEKKLEAFIVEMNGRCPLECLDNWAIDAFKIQDDTAAVELIFPSILGPFLQALTVDTDNAKRVWVRHMSSMLGESWDQFVGLLDAAQDTFVIEFSQGGDFPVATMTFSPDDLIKWKK